MVWLEPIDDIGLKQTTVTTNSAHFVCKFRQKNQTTVDVIAVLFYGMSLYDADLI